MKLLIQRAIGLPAKSVRLPVCKIILYLTPLAKSVFGFIVKAVPLMLIVVGITVPLLFLSSMLLVPALIDSLKDIFITLLAGTFTALFTGSTVFTVGDVPTLKLLVQRG